MSTNFALARTRSGTGAQLLWAWGVLCVVVLVSGCGVFRRVAPPQPDVVEQQLFTQLSSFYCAQKRWPSSWNEVATESGAALDLAYFREPRTSSGRAILFTVEYTTPAGAARKVSFIAPPFCGEQPAAEVVSVAGGRVLFQLPVGFAVLGGAGIQDRWKRPPYPDAAWEDPVSEVVIALRFGEAEVPAVGIAALKSKLESAYEKSVTNLKWLVRKSRKNGAAPFLLHEYESDSVRGRLVTVGLSMPFDGRLLTINIIGPLEQQPAVESVAEQLHASLKLQ